MTTYEISNRTSGAVLGLYEGASEDDAVLAMTVDAGYPSIEAAAEALGVSAGAYLGDLRVDAQDE